MFKIGSPVVYRMPKSSTNPGPRARAVYPASQGETYSYCVDKLWVVTDLRDDKVVVQTRRGKVHVLDSSDPNLRPARWWERLVYRGRFPQVDAET